MTPPLFLVDRVAAGEIAVVGDEGRHAATVRRIRVGETVLVGDGGGSIGAGTVAAVGKDRITVAVSEVTSRPGSAPRYVVVQALARGGRDEDAVEAMTEVGVDEVAGWQAARSTAKWTDRTLTRWQATARAATKQSRRAWLPHVTGPLSTPQVADRLRAADLALVLDPTGRPLATVDLPAAGEVVLVVGPEGGFDDAELSSFTAAGAVTARLGSTVLRSSTAGVAAISVLSAGSRWR